MVEVLLEVQSRGYAIELHDGSFRVVPDDGGTTYIAELIAPLRDDFRAARSLMENIYKVTGTKKAEWRKLLEVIKDRYSCPQEFTSSCLLLTWVGNNYSYAQGLHKNSAPDISFYPRIIKKLEPRVPMALVEEIGIAKALERRIAIHSNNSGLECRLE